MTVLRQSFKYWFHLQLSKEGSYIHTYLYFSSDFDLLQAKERASERETDRQREGGVNETLTSPFSTGVQILDETDCISHSTNTLEKGMNPIILPPAMGK